MNSGIHTYYAIKTTTTKRWFRKPIVQQVVVGITQASNWAWAEIHLANDGVKYDILTKRV